MTLFNNRFRSEPNRWQWWDYSAPGSYFITVCILDKHPLLGQINDGEMHLSECGAIIAQHFPLIAEYHPRVRLDEWVIMPDHIHCIITLGDYQYHNSIAVAGDNTSGGGDAGGGDNGGGGVVVVDKIHEFYLPLPIPSPSSQSPEQPQQSPDPPTPDEIKQYRRMRRRMIIPMIIGKFKMQTSKQINLLMNTPGQKNWQHDYHDHVIRNSNEYWQIKQYIINNPRKWWDNRDNNNIDGDDGDGAS